MAKKTDQTSSMLGDDESASEGERGREGEGEKQREGERQTSSASAAESGRPYCARHNCLMKAASSPTLVTYYQCPVPGCGESAKKLRHASKIPEQPQACDSVRCRQQKEPAYLEVQASRSNLSHLFMECPRCGKFVQQPRPAFTGQVRRQGDDLSAR